MQPNSKILKNTTNSIKSIPKFISPSLRAKIKINACRIELLMFSTYSTNLSKNKKTLMSAMNISPSYQMNLRFNNLNKPLNPPNQKNHKKLKNQRFKKNNRFNKKYQNQNHSKTRSLKSLHQIGMIQRRIKSLKKFKKRKNLMKKSLHKKKNKLKDQIKGVKKILETLGETETIKTMGIVRTIETRSNMNKNETGTIKNQRSKKIDKIERESIRKRNIVTHRLNPHLKK